MKRSPEMEAKRQKVLAVLREDVVPALVRRGHRRELAEAMVEDLSSFGVCKGAVTCEYCEDNTEGEEYIWCRVWRVPGHVHLCLRRKACREVRERKVNKAIDAIINALGGE